MSPDSRQVVEQPYLRLPPFQTAQVIYIPMPNGVSPFINFLDKMPNVSECIFKRFMLIEVYLLYLKVLMKLSANALSYGFPLRDMLIRIECSLRQST